MITYSFNIYKNSLIYIAFLCLALWILPLSCAQADTPKKNHIFYVIHTSSLYSDKLSHYLKHIVSLYYKNKNIDISFQDIYSPTPQELITKLKNPNSMGALPITQSTINALGSISDIPLYASNSTLPMSLFFNYNNTIQSFSPRTLYTMPSCVTTSVFHQLSYILPSKPPLMYVTSSIKECLTKPNIFPIIGGSVLDLEVFSAGNHISRTSQDAFIYNPPNSSSDFYVNILLKNKNDTIEFNNLLINLRVKNKLIKILKNSLGEQNFTPPTNEEEEGI